MADDRKPADAADDEQADTPEHKKHAHDDEIIRLRGEAVNAEIDTATAEREMAAVERELEDRLQKIEHDEEQDSNRVREQLRRTDPT